MKVYTRTIQGHQVLHYSYGTEDWSCNFHNLCEVGEPWQAEAGRMAQELAAERGCRIEEIELRADPWIVEALVKSNPTNEGAT